MPSKPAMHRPPGSQAQARQRDAQRGNANERGYNHRWQKARLAFLAEHPLCVACQAKDRLTPATVVDHVVPHRGDRELFWHGKWQALCRQCHDAKTRAGE